MAFSTRFYFSLFCATHLAPLCLNATAYFDLNPPLHFQELPSDDSRLKQGDELFEAALYPQAITVYQALLKELQGNENPSLLMQTRFHLAQAYFSAQDFHAAIDILNANLNDLLSSKQDLMWRHSLYLKAIILKDLKQYSQAKDAFTAYTLLSQPPELTFNEEALFEIGLINFQLQHYPEAAQAFSAIKTEKTKPRLFILAQLYQARIASQQGNDQEALKILKSLKVKNNDPLYFELNYLQGEIAFKLHHYQLAADHFKKALPEDAPEKNKWYTDTLYHLGWSYLKMGEEVPKEQHQQIESLKKAEETFDLLVKFAPNETNCLALAQCYLSIASTLKEPSYYTKTEALLAKPGIYLSKESKAHALLLRAEAAPSYSARDQFYRELTQEANDPSIFYAKGWYMYALNDFEQGQTLLQSQNLNAAQNAFERSAIAFRKSFELLSEKEPEQAGAALKYQALATSYSKIAQADLKALRILDGLMQQPRLWEKVSSKDEIYYLKGYFAGRLAEGLDKQRYLEIADQALQTAATLPHNTFGAQALSHLGALYYQNEDFKSAESVYLQLVKDYPDSSFAAEGWFWAACCADNLHVDQQIGKERRHYAFTHFPNSPFTAEAYFTYYTYPEYIQGDRTAIKHLQTFTDTYSDTPFLIDANFLIGLDYKRDRKTSEGRWIRKKSLTEAIDSFQKAEMLFDELNEKKLIPADKLDYYTAMRYRATLERAMANLAIADESQGAKQQIYLDYAEEVFKNLSQDLEDKKTPYMQRLFQNNAYPLIDEESSFWLAQTYIKADKDEEANRILNGMIARYRQIGTTRGYYLSRTLDEQGKIAMRQKDYPNAMQLFKKAEEAAKGKVLSTDQKLELWIQQSLCCREMKQFDDAILILSKVINDDAISALRVKAMYLRAETYEQQKRPELARKQLESMVKKGGVWAKKAQEKLDKDDLNDY